MEINEILEKVGDALVDEGTDAAHVPTYVRALLELKDVKSRDDFNRSRVRLADELPRIVKDTTAYGYKYAELPDILEAIKPVLYNHDFFVRWSCSPPVSAGSVTVTCHLVHQSGWQEQATLSGVADLSGKKNEVQAIGSVVSYLKRYTLELVLGIAASKDDDGAASGPSNDHRQPAPKIEPKTLSTAQISELDKLIQQFPDPAEIEASMLAYVSKKEGREISGFGDVPTIHASGLFDGLAKKLKAHQAEVAKNEGAGKED